MQTFGAKGIIPPMKNVLFVCSRNRLRSPTAEQIFASHPGINVDSAGTNRDADNELNSELIQWADIIFVMEKTHRNKIQRSFRGSLNNVRVICLHIPDQYEFMDEELIQILRAKVSRHLPT